MTSHDTPTNRASALLGNWEGLAKDAPNIPDKTHYTHHDRVHFFWEDDRIKGLLETRVESDKTPNKLLLEVQFHENSYLQLEYRNQDKTIFQFGVIILKLSADGRKLSGRFMGFGWEREDIVFGKVEWHRRDQPGETTATDDFADASLRFLGRDGADWTIEIALPPDYTPRHIKLSAPAYRDLHTFAEARKTHGDSDDRSWVDMADLEGMKDLSADAGHNRIRVIRKALGIEAKTPRDIFETIRTKKACYRLRFRPENIVLQ